MKVIGIDPDKDRSGVAVYESGELVQLLNMDLVSFIDWVWTLPEPVTFAIEDGSLINTFYAKYRSKPVPVQLKIARSVGANNQRGLDLIAICEKNGHKVYRYKPRSGNWADNRPKMEGATGWCKNSNPETRSAAFFGWLHLNNKK